MGDLTVTSGICLSLYILNYRDLTHEVAPVMGDLITPYIKSPYIPEQGVLGHYIDRRITTVIQAKRMATSIGQ